MDKKERASLNFGTDQYLSTIGVLITQAGKAVLRASVTITPVYKLQYMSQLHRVLFKFIVQVSKALAN